MFCTKRELQRRSHAGRSIYSRGTTGVTYGLRGRCSHAPRCQASTQHLSGSPANLATPRGLLHRSLWLQPSCAPGDGEAVRRDGRDPFGPAVTTRSNCVLVETVLAFPFAARSAARMQTAVRMRQRRYETMNDRSRITREARTTACRSPFRGVECATIGSSDDFRRLRSRRLSHALPASPRVYPRYDSRARARLTCRRRDNAFSLICLTRSRVMPSNAPISSRVIGSLPSRPK